MLSFSAAQGAVGYVLESELSPGEWITPEGEKRRYRKPRRKEKGDQIEPIGAGGEKAQLSMKMVPGLEGRKAANKAGGLACVSPCSAVVRWGTLGKSLTTLGFRFPSAKRGG